MKNKLLFNVSIVIVLSMLPSRLLASEIAVNPLTEQKSFLARTCETPLQLIPMLMGHANLAQFALLGLQFPEETVGSIKEERETTIHRTQQPVKLDSLCLLNSGEMTCRDMYRIT